MGCGSFAAVYLFFLEYLWPLRRVHLFSDIEGYHWPLLSYAYQSLREGRFPQWDPSIYCGVSFVGNPQAALFYPPNWLLFAMTWPRRAISFVTLEFVDALHFWAALLLVYVWFRDRGNRVVTALVCGLGYAFGGYAVGDIQHLGATNAYTWFPLGLWGIEQASRSGGYRPLWKLVLASALAFLAGYPPEWAVLAVCAVTYAMCLPNRWRLAAATVAGLLVSLGICAVQLLPALEASKLKVAAKYYGDPLPWVLFSNLFLPNRFNQSRAVPMGPGEEQYLYIGAAGLFALGWLAVSRRWRAALPGIAIAGVCVWTMRNPFGWTGALLDALPRFTEIVRGWNFLAGLALAATLLTGAAMEDVLARRWRGGFGAPVAGACLLWCGWLWYVWIPGGRDFGVGSRSALEAGISVALFSALLFAMPARRVLSSAALVLLVYTEYKVYGTNRRFSAAEEDVDRFFAVDARTGGAGMIGLDNAVYGELRKNRHYRIALLGSIVHDDMRHYMLATPQGLDPMLPDQYRREVERYVAFHSDREFWPDPFHEESMRQLAVRYVVLPQTHEAYAKLRGDARFRLMEPSGSFYHAFEYLGAQAIVEMDKGTARPVEWSPERRVVAVDAAQDGTLVFREQFAAGWTATVDGAPVAVERHGLAFQKIRVPAGKHAVQFTYRSPALLWGALVSLGCAIALLFAAGRSRTAFGLRFG